MDLYIYLKSVIMKLKKFIFVLNVSDDEFTTSKTSKVKFIDVNEKPVFTTNANLTIAENSKVVGTHTATDPENDTVTFRSHLQVMEIQIFYNQRSSGELAFRNAQIMKLKINTLFIYMHQIMMDQLPIY